MCALVVCVVYHYFHVCTVEVQNCAIAFSFFPFLFQFLPDHKHFLLFYLISCTSMSEITQILYMSTASVNVQLQLLSDFFSEFDEAWILVPDGPV